MPTTWQDVFLTEAEWKSQSRVELGVNCYVDYSEKLARKSKDAIDHALAAGEDLSILRAPAHWDHQGTALDEIILAADVHQLRSTVFASDELNCVFRLVAHNVPIITAMDMWKKQWHHRPPGRRGFLAAIAAGCTAKVECLLSCFGHPHWQHLLGRLVESSDKLEPEHLEIWLQTTKLLSQHVMPSGADILGLTGNWTQLADLSTRSARHFVQESGLFVEWSKLQVLAATGLNLRKLWEPPCLQSMVIGALLYNWDPQGINYIRKQGATIRCTMVEIRELLDKLELWLSRRGPDEWEDIKDCWPRAVAWYHREAAYVNFVRRSLHNAPGASFSEVYWHNIEAYWVGPANGRDDIVGNMQSPYHGMDWQDVYEDVYCEMSTDEWRFLIDAIIDTGWRGFAGI